jgi:tRNA (guanine-N7-)-methyltransferase
MKTSRLEQLYLRRLVFTEKTGRTFPIAHVLEKKLSYYPEKPATLEFDILEIGPGNGDFLLHLAATHPDKKILAIEMDPLRCTRIVGKLKKSGIKNVTIAEGDARVPLACDMEGTALEKIFVLFPDPWPRNRHRYKRLLSKEFLALVCAKLKPGGEFTLATDVRDYADWAASNFAAVPFMEPVHGKGDTRFTPLPDLIPTAFEQRWKELGRTCHYVRYARRTPG